MEILNIKKTSVFIFVFLAISICYFFFSYYTLDTIISYIMSFGLKMIPLFTLVISIAVFWLAKFIVNRSWDFKLVWFPLVIIIMSLFIILFV